MKERNIISKVMAWLMAWLLGICACLPGVAVFAESPETDTPPAVILRTVIENEGVLSIQTAPADQPESENTIEITAPGKELQLPQGSTVSLQTDRQAESVVLDGKSRTQLPEELVLMQDTELQIVFPPAAVEEPAAPEIKSQDNSEPDEDRKTKDPAEQTEVPEKPTPASDTAEKPEAGQEAGSGPDDPVWIAAALADPLDAQAPYTGSLVHVSVYTHLQSVPMPWGGSITNGIWTLSNGMTAFCGDGLANPPKPASIPLSDPVLCDELNVRKALYYGYGGPENQMTSLSRDQQIILTNELLSVAYTGKSIATSSSNGFHWNSGVKNWYSNVMNLPAPPTEWKVWYIPFKDASIPSWSGSYKSQPLFYGKIEQPEGSLRIRKSDAQPSLTEGNFRYSLQGAQYGIYSSQENAAADRQRIATLTIQADQTSDSADSLKAGQTYYAKEVKAPAGYRPNPQIYQARAEAGQTIEIKAEDTPLYSEDWMQILKKNRAAQSGQPETEQALSLGKAKFEISWWKGKDYSGKADRVCVFETDSQGRIDFSSSEQMVSGNGLISDADGKIVWPLGLVSLRELEAPAGFVRNDSIYEGEIVQQKDQAVFVWKETPDYTYSLEQKQVICAEKPLLGSLQILKTSSDESIEPSCLAGAQFTLTNVSGHPVWYDADQDGKMKTEEMIPDGGTVCVLTTDQQAKAALPPRSLGYGTYRIRETKAPEGFSINGSFDKTFVIDRDGVLVELTCYDVPIRIHTSAKADNGIQETQAAATVRITDTVRYEGLDSRVKYRMKGWLVDAESREVILDAEGNRIEAVSEDFAAKKPDGSVRMEFVFDASALAGKRVTVFEELYSVHGQQEILEAEHKQAGDTGQTIALIDLGTQAQSGQGQTTSARKEIRITDTVSYTGLEPGRSYEIRGILMNQKDGNPLLDAQGKEIVSHQSFTPHSPDGQVQMVFIFDGSHLQDLTTVVFETLYKEGVEVGVHADLHDRKQTITLTSLRLRLTKTDEKGNPVSGKPFEFGLYEDAACSRKIRTLSSDGTSASILIESLHAGDSFYLKEEKAPAGYSASSKIIHIEAGEEGITANGKPLETEQGIWLLSVANTKNRTPASGKPKTSAGSGLVLWIALGAALAVLAAVRLLQKAENRK